LKTSISHGITLHNTAQQHSENNVLVPNMNTKGKNKSPKLHAQNIAPCPPRISALLHSTLLPKPFDFLPACSLPVVPLSASRIEEMPSPSLQGTKPKQNMAKRARGDVAEEGQGEQANTAGIPTLGQSIHP
jgi:hypothetical protein